MIREAVASVLAQSYRPIEILIVDDGSTDDSLQVARELEVLHPEIIRVFTQENVGAGPAREQGRIEARGEFIQYLDSDDLLHPEKFQLQVNALREHPECDIAYGITRLIDSKGLVLKEPFKWTAKKQERLFPGLLVDRWWCTHTPLYRRSLTDRIGSWSDLRYSQDWEYDARAGALKARLVFVDALVSEHRHHQGTRQTGHGRWLSPEDQVRFFTSLYENAIKAGVSQDSAEMKHFSRWVFSAARRAGAIGEKVAANELLSLARRSVDDKYFDQILYQKTADLIGWNTITKLEKLTKSLRKKNRGPHTIKQSWMNP
jgi:glycosyltransferase involved in cell wall biosynthesis